MRPVIIAYDKFDTGDLGFKLLDNGDYSDIDKRLDELPYVFMRSDIANEMRRTLTLPPTLYLRNKTHNKDYMIEFRDRKDLNTFLALFPESFENEKLTQAYYFVPCAHDHVRDKSKSENTSDLQDQSESHDTSQ